MNLFKTSIRIIFIMLLFITEQQSAFAIGQPIVGVLDGNKNQLHTDSSTTVTDYNYFNPAFLLKVDTPYLIKNSISLRINEASTLYLRDSFSVTVQTRIYYRNLLTAAYDSVDKIFTVNYDSTKKYQSVSSFIFNGAHDVKVKVLSVTSTVSWNVLPALMLENEMVSSPAYKFSCASSDIDSVSYTVDSLSTQGELYVSWQAVDSADRYDLEWAYIDSSALADSVYGIPTSPDPDLIFNNNATRVNISGTSYMIPLLYDDTGSLFFRVRPVQLKNYQIVAANWSTDHLPKGLGWFNYGGHQRNLNWQSTTTYAEDGKRKIVVQYYDGSLRNRQTVTKDNTTNTTVVAETLYDHQGRPTIQVLPAPTLSSIIQYSHDFNVAGLNGTAYDATSIEYTKSLYDTLLNASDYCEKGAQPMDTTNGASKYYSLNNPQRNVGYNRFIPNGEGYVFTQTQYKQDNTGRISKQSGVGPAYQIGSGHETKYFYGSPDQKELDALFGTEVGSYSHYFKNMVADANGQFSVSYVDMHGRTIATALAGQSPAALQKLSSNIIDTLPETLASASSNITDGLVMQSQKSLVLSSDGNNTFHYDLSPASLKKPDCNNDTVCYDCLYNLEITITDDCDNQKLGGNPVIIRKSNFSIGAIDTSCNAAAGFNFDTTIFLLAGNYQITKKLSVSNYGENYYRDSVFMLRNACRSLQQFIQQQQAVFATANSGDCSPSCAACTAALGSFETFKTNFFTSAGVSNSDTAKYKSQVITAYTDAQKECNELCGYTNNDDAIKKAMLIDVTPPFGQYANPDSSADIYSIFHIEYNGDSSVINKAAPYQSTGIVYLNNIGQPDSVLDDATQTLVPPQQLDAAQFAEKFNSSWTEQLLQFHPEDFKLNKYATHHASLTWDNNFEKIDTYKDAVDQGYFNPLSGSGGITANIDPFSTDESNKFQSQLSDSLNYYFNGTIKMSLWTLACVMVKCGDISITSTDTSCLNWCRIHTFDTTTMCTGDLDMAWRNFREMYLNIKQSLLYSELVSSCPTPSAATIMAANHRPNFISTAAGLIQYGLDATVTAANAGDVETKVQNAISSNQQINCQSYVSQWVQQLSPCNYSQAAINDTIIPMLVTICEKGTDVSHPYGASSISPDSSNAFNSFEDALNDYNSHHGITNSYTCNAELITTPLPFNLQASGNNLDIWSRPDDCQCSMINNMYTQYTINGKSDSSFSAYMKRTTNTVISDADLLTLRSMCATTTASCKFLTTPVSLPPALQCGVQDVCATCSQVGILDQAYLKEFGTNNTPRYLAGDSTDSVQLKINTLFSNYMNNHLGFAFQYYDYLEFMDKCSANRSSTRLDTLQRILAAYQNNSANKLIPHLDQGGCDTSVLKINMGGWYADTTFKLVDWMSDGAFKMPQKDTANLVHPNASICTNFNYVDTLCVNNSFSAESRVRFPIDSLNKQKYQQFGSPGTLYGSFAYEFLLDKYNFFVYLTTNYFDSYLSADSIYAYVLIADSTGNYFVNDRHLSTGLTNLSSWVDIKVNMKDGNGNVYLNGNLLDTIHYTTPFSKFYATGMSPYGYDLQIDWFKMYDSTNTLRYFEDFNGCDSLGKQTLPHQCDNCQQEFANYFNNAQGTNYSFSTIDSIYYNETGVHPTPCDPPPPSCDTIQSVLQDFQNFYSGIDFSQIYQNRKITKCAQELVNSANAMISCYNNPTQQIFNDGYARAIFTGTPNPFAPDTTQNKLKGTGNSVFGVASIVPLSLDCAVTDPPWRSEDKPSILGIPISDTDFVAPYLIDRNKIAGKQYIAPVYTSGGVSIFGSVWGMVNGFSGYYLGAPFYDFYGYDGLPKPSNKFLFQDTSRFEYVAMDGEVQTSFLQLSAPIINPTQFASIYTSGTFISLSQIKSLSNLRFDPNAIDFAATPDLSARGLKVTVNYLNGSKGELFLADSYDGGYLVVKYQDIIDSNLYNQDCKKSFTTYFNTRFNTNYTYAQIAGLYHQCNRLITDPCSSDVDSTLCGRSAPLFPNVVLPVDNSCTDSTNFALITGTNMYDAYTDSLRDAFDSSYRHKCLAAFNYEHFTDVHAVAEYQYTLYYYDQAGNLVKTVPPKGVALQRRQSWYDSVATARATNVYLPNSNNTLVTQYRYNSLNQVIAQQSPDGGLSHFWYDRLGRLTFSQNAKQQPANQYSYTLYDSIGRITEVGQIVSTTVMTDDISRVPASLTTWFTGADNTRTQITQTVYDAAYVPFGSGSTVLDAQNLRNRVAYTSYYNTAADIGFGGQASATYYSYDIHGNVDTLLQDYKQGAMDQNNRFKKIVYNYDLVSGKVNNVAYQPNQADAFYHSYLYDAENRLINVQTSRDSVNWDNDAYYQYYKHGPLARTILGQQQVQGINYAYTLQGWMKAVNPIVTGAGFDHTGDDGTSTTIIPKDEYRFSLNYFNNDYAGIGAGVSSPTAGIPSQLSGDNRQLYNGNISSMAVNILQLNQPLLYNYQYDQLNRLVQMDAWKADTAFTVLTKLADFHEQVAYDANGNILSYLRNGNNTFAGKPLGMDSLTYNYNSNNNQLNYVQDAVADGNYTEDIDNQIANNYHYDAIGNITQDLKENIDSITWTVYGKIDSIHKTDNTSIKYTYDASGNRISKMVHGISADVGTYYVRDASGNVMSVYGTNSAINNGNLTQMEIDLYGSSRLGLITTNTNVQQLAPAQTTYLNNLKDSAVSTNFMRGAKQYELTNHLGNVLVTISDKKKIILVDTSTATGSCVAGTGLTELDVNNRVTSILNYTASQQVDLLTGFSSNDGDDYVVEIDTTLTPCEQPETLAAGNYYKADVVTAGDYYPFGMTLPGRTYTNGTNSYRYSINGQEKSDEIASNTTTAKYWEYDARIGRRWNTDPLTGQLPSWSPYSTMADDPILMFDVDGKFPYPIHIRSFAPYKTFGLGFSGDNRGYSTALGVEEGGTVTSRIQQTFVVDPTAATHTNPLTWSDPSHHPLFGTKTGKPTGDISDFTSLTDKQGNSTVSFTANYAGNVPLIPSADIDVHTKFTLVENTKAGTLNVTATQTGDQYPSAETLIGDTKGNQLFIGVSPAVGFEDRQSLGPYEKLPGDNNLPMMTNSFTVLLDKKGVFTGVKQGDKTYSVADWNKMMGSKPLEKQQEKPLPVH